MHFRFRNRAMSFLKCETCLIVFETVVQFGKHICASDNDEQTDEIDLPRSINDSNYSCSICHKNFKHSKKRFVHQHFCKYFKVHFFFLKLYRFQFHRQFHLPSPRPKVCLICELSFNDESTFYEHVNFSHEPFPQYSCMYCDKSYTVEQELQRHELAHRRPRNFQCDDCGKTFLNKQALKAHTVSDDDVDHNSCIIFFFFIFQLLHDNNYNKSNRMECEICKKCFTRKARLRKHMLTHEQYEPTVLPMCVGCERVFDDDSQAVQHCCPTDANHDDNPSLVYQTFTEVLCCEFCAAIFASVIALVEHKTYTHAAATTADLYECNLCSSRFNQYSKLRTHSIIHSSPAATDARVICPVRRLYACDETGCLKTFTDWRNLQSHRKNLHLLNPSIYKCNECDTTFFQSWTLAYHKRRAHSDPLQCPFCTQTFVLPRTLQLHVKRLHADADELPSSIINSENNKTNIKKSAVKQSSAASVRTTTNKNFTFIFEKYINVMRVDNTISYHCQECTKIFSSRSHAITHVSMIHLKLMNFTCDICSKGFYQRGDLNDHMRLHTSERPFSCPHCDYRARKASMLSAHLRRHSDVRPFACNECPRSYKRGSVLKTHMKRHERLDNKEITNKPQLIESLQPVAPAASSKVIYILSGRINSVNIYHFLL